MLNGSAVNASRLARSRLEPSWSLPTHQACIGRSCDDAPTFGVSHARSSANEPARRTLSPPVVPPGFLKIAVRTPDTTTTAGNPAGDGVGIVAPTWENGAVLESTFPTRFAM